MTRHDYLDLVSLVHERIDTFSEMHAGASPTVLTLSPHAFAWLIAVFQEDVRVLGASPIDPETWTYTTDRDVLRIEIDELCDDYEVLVS